MVRIIVVILRKNKAFVSSFVLVLFISFISATIAYLSSIRYNYLNIDNMIAIEESLYIEAKVIYKFECLVYEDIIQDYLVDGIYVRVYQDYDVYILEYEGNSLRVWVENNEIIKYNYN